MFRVFEAGIVITDGLGVNTLLSSSSLLLFEWSLSDEYCLPSSYNSFRP